MDEVKYTWADAVKGTMDEIVNQASSSENELEKALFQAIAVKCKEHFDTISLARIATALYKLAELPDEFTDENILGEMLK